MASNLLTSLGFVTIDHFKDFVMMTFTGCRIDLDVWDLSPCPLYLVVILVVINRYGLMHNVSDEAHSFNDILL